MRRLSIVVFLSAIGILVLCSGPPAFGQGVTGSITGYITDPSGAAIPNAKVMATEVRTNVATTRNADVAGLYLITNILPGDYNITVEATGFKVFTQSQVHLEVGGTVRADAKLEVGTFTQHITVEAQSAAVETEKTDVS